MRCHGDCSSTKQRLRASFTDHCSCPGFKGQQLARVKVAQGLEALSRVYTPPKIHQGRESGNGSWVGSCSSTSSTHQPSLWVAFLDGSRARASRADRFLGQSRGDSLRLKDSFVELRQELVDAQHVVAFSGQAFRNSLSVCHCCRALSNKKRSDRDAGCEV